MPCFSPISAYRLRCGSISFSEVGDIAETLQLPCGRCIGCRLKRAQEWAIRCTHEAQLHDRNCFITLTYDEKHLPANGSLDHRHVQLFFKKLRRKGYKFRYLMCGEYGEQLSRPHYHACLFGVDFFEEWKPILKGSSGEMQYESKTLSETWGMGFATVSRFTQKTAGYVARYSLKKVIGKDGKFHYSDVVIETGEVHFLKPPYLRASIKPAIGRSWFEKFSTDVITLDQVVLNGKKMNSPRYYDKLVKRRDALLADDIKQNRALASYETRADNTADRLAVKEVVKKAQIQSLKRSI